LGETAGSLPSDFGWDHFEGSLGADLENYYSWTKVTSDAVTGNSSDTVKAYATLENVANAAAWIGAQTTPWMATVSFNAPHWSGSAASRTYQAPPSGTEYQTRTSTENKAIYRSMLECLDRSISNLLSSIDSNVLERTTIILMGDNGTETAISDHFATLGGKGDVREGGVNVPLVIADGYAWLHGTEGSVLKGRGRIVSPNRVETKVVQTMDLFATIAAIGYGDATCGADSISMLPYLQGTNVAAQRGAILAEALDTTKWHDKPGDAGWDVAIRNGSYKFVVRNYGSTKTGPGNQTSYELFDLANDRWETTDIHGTVSVYLPLMFLLEIKEFLAVPEPCP